MSGQFVERMPGNSEREEVEDDELPDQPFELRTLRQLLPKEIQAMLGVSRRELLVEGTISQKILRIHPADHLYLQQLGRVIEHWELAGPSPKAPDRFEIYARLDEIWFTVVVRCDQSTGCSSLITMHRIYRRKVESRVRKGYLTKRGE